MNGIRRSPAAAFTSRIDKSGRNQQSLLPSHSKTHSRNRLAESLQQRHQHRDGGAKLTQVDKGACEGHSQDDHPMLQELLLLVPSLETRVGRMNPRLLNELLQDTGRIASKLVRMKQLFPTADICKIVHGRPSILSDIEFDLIEGTAANLYQTFPNQDVCWMVTCQPVLLVEDIDYILQELGRLMTASRVSVVSILGRDPNLATSVSCNRALWGAEEF